MSIYCSTDFVSHYTTTAHLFMMHTHKYMIIVRTSGRKRRKIIVTFVPPKSNTWKLQVCKEMQGEVLKCLDNMLRIDRKVLLLGDLNCKHVDWEKWNEIDMLDDGG